MDLIRRQDAIDALWKALYEYEDKTEKQFIESDDLDVWDWILHRIFVQNMSDIDRQTILELPSAQPEPRWVPCSERLPEVSEAHIVSGKQKYEFETKWSYFVDVAVYDPTGEGYIGPWQTFGDWNEGQETYITAWMELPEPYKGEANESKPDQ